MSLRLDLKAPIRTNVSLKSYSTFKIGGLARYFTEPETQEELFRVLEFQKAEHLPFYIVGRGSNLLFSDAGFPGLVISLRKFEPNRYSIERECWLRVSGGMSLFRVSILSQEHGLGGAEFVCHIPGTVGGALMMNAGFGRKGSSYFEVKDIFESCTVLDLSDSLDVKTLNRGDIRFEYRKSSIQNHFLILDVTFHLRPKPSEEVEEEIKANFAYRNSVQDLRYPSAGSTFKNPKSFPLTAGQILDQVQMKRMRVGGAMVSERHANFFLNVDHAKAQDVLDLMAIAQKRAFETFGVQLEPEVRYVE